MLSALDSLETRATEPEPISREIYGYDSVEAMQAGMRRFRAETRNDGNRVTIRRHVVRGTA